MYKCKYCQKEYENKYSYMGHCSSHNRKKVIREKDLLNEKVKITRKCKYCDLEFENGLKLGGHQTWCKLNPSLEESKTKIGKIFKGKNLTDEQKNKISISRKKYLDENPGNIPYLLNHSSKESYPEKIFREKLESISIVGWVYNYPVKRYSLDFAFIDKLIDVEIDGETHNLPEVIKKDRIRTKELSKLGWTTIRFTSSQIKNNIDECINILLSILK
jgi:very-short-patch-repair endonuclease